MWRVRGCIEVRPGWHQVNCERKPNVDFGRASAEAAGDGRWREKAFADRYARSALWNCGGDTEDLAINVLRTEADHAAGMRTPEIQGGE